MSSGARFRPPIIVSSGPSLLIRFYANGGTGLGYKAFYSFILVDIYEKANQPVTDCGGYVDNQGGTITMMDMVEDGVQTYDCVWIIKPPKSFMHMRTHMYLKVITFAEMGKYYIINVLVLFCSACFKISFAIKLIFFSRAGYFANRCIF